MNCNEAIAALVASLENGTAITEEQRAHIRDCERCREARDAAKELLAVIPGEVEGSPAIDAAVTAAEHEVRRKRFWRGVRVLLAVLSLMAASAATLLVQTGEMRMGDALFFAGAGFVIALLVALPLLLIVWFVRGAGGKSRLYKRLGPGRMLAGVCLGLSEVANTDVRLLRIIFVVLMLIDGAGIWLYLLLYLAMPVHPDDRQYLLRFRVRRWWQRKTSHAVSG